MKNRTLIGISAVSGLLVFAAPTRGQDISLPDARLFDIGASDSVAVVSVVPPGADRRGRLLPTLYLSFGGLQGYDAYATLLAPRRGAAEINPITRATAGQPAVFLASKAALAATSIWLADDLSRRHHRRAAMTAMIVSNAIAAAVAVRNAAVLRR